MLKGAIIPYIHLSTQWCTSQWCTQGRLHSLRTPGYSVHHCGVFKVEFFACVHHDWEPEYFPVLCVFLLKFLYLTFNRNLFVYRLMVLGVTNTGAIRVTCNCIG